MTFSLLVAALVCAAPLAGCNPGNPVLADLFVPLPPSAEVKNAPRHPPPLKQQPIVIVQAEVIEPPDVDWSGLYAGLPRDGSVVSTVVTLSAASSRRSNQMQVDLRRWEQQQEISRQQRFHQDKGPHDVGGHEREPVSAAAGDRGDEGLTMASLNVLVIDDEAALRQIVAAAT